MCFTFKKRNLKHMQCSNTDTYTNIHSHTYTNIFMYIYILYMLKEGHTIERQAIDINTDIATTEMQLLILVG